MKKVLLFIICLALIAVSTPIAFMEEGFDVIAEADTDYASVGDEVTIIVSLGNTTESKSGSISVTLDEGLELVSGEMLFTNALMQSFDNTTGKGVVTFRNLSGFDGDFAKLVVRVVSSGNENKSVTITVKLNPSGLSRTTVITIPESEGYTLSEWVWESNYSKATAVFVNLIDDSDTITVTDESIERQLVEPTVDDTAYVFKYTASVEGPDGETYTDQKVENALFAGWYKDAEFTECYTEAPAEGEEKYAKWVDPMILGLQFQLKKEASVADEKTVLRVLTSVDTLNFENVGFVVKYVNGAGEEVFATFKSDTVYKKVTGTSELGSFDFEPTIFSPDSARFCAFNLTIPQSLFDTVINYTAFWTTYDGTVVYGQSGNMTLSGHMSQD